VNRVFESRPTPNAGFLLICAQVLASLGINPKGVRARSAIQQLVACRIPRRRPPPPREQLSTTSQRNIGSRYWPRAASGGRSPNTIRSHSAGRASCDSARPTGTSRSRRSRRLSSHTEPGSSSVRSFGRRQGAAAAQEVRPRPSGHRPTHFAAIAKAAATSSSSHPRSWRPAPESGAGSRPRGCPTRAASPTSLCAREPPIFYPIDRKDRVVRRRAEGSVVVLGAEAIAKIAPRSGWGWIRPSSQPTRCGRGF
jgi:hypothetical protein